MLESTTSAKSVLMQSLAASKGGLEVRNPADGTLLANVKAYDAVEVETVIAQMHAAWPAWSGLSAKVRSTRLKAWNNLILDHADELAQIVTLECGKPLGESMGEVVYAASFVEWFAEEARRAYGEVIPAHVADKRLLTIRQPVGVSAAITPWNFPLAMITRKAGPALAAGCAMIVKPAEATPLSALALEYLAHQAGIPADIFRVVPTTDPAAIGDVFCRTPEIRKLSFTGSTRIGKLLLEKCATTVKRVSMELGGNAPFIVFDDADIDAAVEGAIASKFRNAGQTCVCTNRLLVQDGIHDAFVAALARRVSGLKVGRGDEAGTDIGPIINQAGVAKVDALVTQAVAMGAEVHVGGGRHPAGAAFYAPTVLSKVTPDMDIFRTEIFGPVAPISRFATEDEAVRLANDTPYGLAAYFFTTDAIRMWRVMEKLEYGMVGVNDGLISTEIAPFGGVKESGIGREGSRHGLDEYMEWKYVSLGGIGAKS
ncbi:NAD-dependent succinate-semialdehyde dehydrogenase [Hyphomonas sp.]|uniref:NAD-dependent succinate-semialdehyde dehydrogenase n=1 Tax=Hyphomonas sp. TaxID=87 RepID=UPI0030F7B4AD